MSLVLHSHFSAVPVHFEALQDWFVHRLTGFVEIVFPTTEGFRMKEALETTQNQHMFCFQIYQDQWITLKHQHFPCEKSKQLKVS